MACGICGGPHENHNCMSIQDDQFSTAQVNFVNNQPRPPYNDPHSNTYNPGWRIIQISVGEEIKDSKGKITIKLLKIFKDNHHSLQLNLLQSNQVTLKMP
ncbi:hypothetical protein PIB30_100992 [Stylosanthes scabra]|uniref:Uncharacterized protein n=1 Tax=Stylosanthes scabra TaxID=79078 RepID=A0ABU6QYC8_9FABA|nr:hypothetical protein [Stylosanthes scabra]